MHFAQICLYFTILYSMKKYKNNKILQHHIPDKITTAYIEEKQYIYHNWKLLSDSPFSETGW